MKQIFAVIFAVMLLTGCSKEEMNQMVADAKKSAGELQSSAGDALDKAKSSAGDAVAKAKQAAQKAGDLAALGGSGSGTMMLDANTSFSASYIRLIPLEGGAAVLQIKSNRDDSTEAFPSFLIQGQVTASSLEQLVGSPIACRVFAQRDRKAPVWSDHAGDPVMVSLAKNKQMFTATFSGATLFNSTDESKITSSGTFECAEY